MQAFINQSFENITSIEHSLKLLHKFQSILQRESLKSDLDSKLNIIFQVRLLHYAMYTTVAETKLEASGIGRTMIEKLRIGVRPLMSTLTN